GRRALARPGNPGPLRQGRNGARREPRGGPLRGARIRRARLGGGISPGQGLGREGSHTARRLCGAARFGAAGRARGSLGIVPRESCRGLGGVAPGGARGEAGEALRGKVAGAWATLRGGGWAGFGPWMAEAASELANIVERHRLIATGMLLVVLAASGGWRASVRVIRLWLERRRR